MKELIVRTRMTYFITLIITLVLVVVFVYLPLDTALEASVIENYHTLAETKYVSVETLIDRRIEGALSLSSRTMIRNTMVEYTKGTMSLEELKAYVEPKYVDGAKALDGLVYAKRSIGDEIIGAYGESATLPSMNIEKLEFESELEVLIEEFDHKTYMVVYSPVLHEDVAVGYDLVYYCVEDRFDTLGTKDITVYLMPTANIDFYIENEFRHADLYQYDNQVGYVRQLLDDYFVIVEISKTDLLKEVMDISFRSLLTTIIALIVLFMLINTYVVGYARKLLDETEQHKDEFKEKAYYDKLTGAYTRFYMDAWYEDEVEDKDFPLFVAMLDMDNFKSINDSYGHDVGDQILKQTAEEIIRSIDDDGIVIRYGGDEFILIMLYDNILEAEKRMAYIKNQLNELIKHNLDFSYGIQLVEEKKDFYDVLKLADQGMFEQKNYKKAKRK